MFDVIDDPAKNAFQISSAVVSIHNNWLQTTLDYMFVPVLVEKLTLATHTEYHEVEAAVLVELHFCVQLLS